LIDEILTVVVQLADSCGNVSLSILVVPAIAVRKMFLFFWRQPGVPEHGFRKYRNEQLILSDSLPRL
jgi:hypothetical protein